MGQEVDGLGKVEIGFLLEFVGKWINEIGKVDRKVQDCKRCRNFWVMVLRGF